MGLFSLSAGLLELGLVVGAIVVAIISISNSTKKPSAPPAQSGVAPAQGGDGPTKIGPITPVIQPKPKNPNSGLNILTFLGGALLVWATMMFVAETDGAAVPPTIITLTLLTYIVGIFLYKKAPFLKPVAMTFTVASLLIFPFLFFAFTNMGLDEHVSGILSTISTFIALTLSSTILPNRVLPYFAYIWLGAVAYALVPDSWESERLYIYYLVPLLMAFPAMYAWVKRVKWLPVHWRHAARSFAYGIIPLLILPFLALLAVASHPYTADEIPPFICTIFGAIVCCFYGLWWTWSKQRNCIYPVRIAVQVTALSLIYESIIRFGGYEATNSYYYHYTPYSQLDALTLYIATSFSFIAQFVLGIIIKDKNQFGRIFDRIVAIVSFVAIISCAGAFSTGDSQVDNILLMTSCLLVGAMGVIQSIFEKNSLWAIATIISLLIVPVSADDLLESDVEDIVYCVYYSIATLIFAGSYAFLRKNGRVQALIMSLIGTSLAGLMSIGVSSSLDVTFVGWAVLSLALGIIALIDNNKVILEVSAYSAIITIATLVGYVFDSITLQAPVASSSHTSYHEFTDYVTAIIIVHIVTYGIMAVGYWRERARRYKVRFAIGYYSFSLIALIFAAGGIDSYSTIIPAVLYLVQQAIFIVMSVMRRYEWLTWSALVAIIFDIFLLMSDYGWLSVAIVGLLLIFIAAWKMTQNHRKGQGNGGNLGGGSSQNQIAPSAPEQKPIEPIEKPVKEPIEPIEKSGEKTIIATEKTDVTIEESSIEISR